MSAESSRIRLHVGHGQDRHYEDALVEHLLDLIGMDPAGRSVLIGQPVGDEQEAGALARGGSLPGQIDR